MKSVLTINIILLITIIIGIIFFSINLHKKNKILNKELENQKKSDDNQLLTN